MDLYIIEVVMLVLLMVLMFYLSAISAAYTAFDLKDIEENTKNKKIKNKNKRIKQLLKNQSKFIRALDMGIIFTELCTAAIAVEVIANPIYSENRNLLIFKYICIFTTTFLITYVSLIFTKLLPKHIGFRHSKLITYATIDIIYVLAVLFSPVAYFLHKTDDFFIKAFEKTNKEKDKFSDAEFKSKMELEAETGTLSKENKIIVSNIVMLDKLNVDIVMKDVDKLKAIDTEFSREEVMKYSRENDFAFYPVYDRDINNILGIVSIKKIFQNEVSETFRIEKLITPTIFVTGRKKIATLFKEMKKDRIHMAIVQDDNKKVIGFVTKQDIYDHLIENTKEDE